MKRICDLQIGPIFQYTHVYLCSVLHHFGSFTRARNGTALLQAQTTPIYDAILRRDWTHSI